MKRICLLAGWIAAAVLTAVARAGTVECSSWNDTQANIAFPGRIGELKMLNRSDFGEDGYSLLYVSREWIEKLPGPKAFSIYLVTRDGVSPEKDGVGPEVLREFGEAADAVQLKVKSGEYESVRPLSDGKRITLPKSGLECIWQPMEAQQPDGRGSDFCAVLVTAYGGRFLKLRYTEANVSGGTTEPPVWREMLAKVDELIRKGADDRAVDVYAIKDDAERLEALRRKWAGVGDRVSQWEMPDYVERFSRIDGFQRWCDKDKKNRFPKFEVACRDAIGMKIEPAIWYYNLACVYAVGGKADDAIENLEKAVAAGYGPSFRVREDEDMALLLEDRRFIALCGAMEARRGRWWYQPAETIDIDRDQCPRLTDRNVYYSLRDELFNAEVCTTNENAIVYLNRHIEHPDIPADGLVCPFFEGKAREHGCDCAALNIYFNGATTIYASDAVFGETDIGEDTSIPAALGVYSAAEKMSAIAAFHQALGIYAVGRDYGADGVDRFVGHFPLCVAHEGDAEESDKFVRLVADIIRALPEKNRDDVTFHVLSILRRAQKCVKEESDLMTGIAQRPVLRYSDIDAKKAVALAGNPESVDMPFIIADGSKVDFKPTPVTDLWCSPWNLQVLSGSLANLAFNAQWGEYTGRFLVKTDCREGARREWRVLQGDPSKVRFLPHDDDTSLTSIEVDYHEAFEALLPGGRKILTSRVDIGCFAVKDGRTSMPVIVSVFFNPNETRCYDQNHRLVSIDYARRQIDAFRPRVGVKGNWKDVFTYDDDGGLSGWYRYAESGNGTVLTNEFTRDGLVVDTRDDLGRPKDVRRSLVSEWIQHMGQKELLSDTTRSGWVEYCGLQYDGCEAGAQEATLAWKYTYDGDTDRYGKPRPKEPVPFRYRPELCTRAEFSEESGFRFPLADQMKAGHDRYEAYCRDMPGEDIDSLAREDGREALRKCGLVPPKTLKKMRFCPWSPSTNDVWTCDLYEDEQEMAKMLVELPEGVYRAAFGSREGGRTLDSVAVSYSMVNAFLEVKAFEQLDARYPRCKEAEINRLMPELFAKDSCDGYFLVESGCVSPQELPEGKHSTLAMWKIGRSRYVLVCGIRDSLTGDREYCLLTMGSKTGKLRTLDMFHGLPTRAIGNTVLAANGGVPEAANNLAVLLYSGIANSDKYDEESVIVLLEQAADDGCAAAKYNLGVLYENRGEKFEAFRYYEEARAMGFK